MDGTDSALPDFFLELDIPLLVKAVMDGGVGVFLLWVARLGTEYPGGEEFFLEVASVEFAVEDLRVEPLHLGHREGVVHEDESHGIAEESDLEHGHGFFENQRMVKGHVGKPGGGKPLAFAGIVAR